MGRFIANGSRSEWILVVDDEEFIRDIVARWLVAEGYHCVPAVGAAEAIQLLRRQPFHLVLADITMPGLSGIDLLDVVRSEFPDVAVTLATGVSDRQTAIDCLERGAFGYVIKPFDRNELIISVANALTRRDLEMGERRYRQRLEAEVVRRTAELREREEELAVRMVAAAARRDNETGAHIRRIGLYSEVLVERLGWEPKARGDLRLAAALHDVGKIGVPDSILLKPGKLTADEFAVMKTHTTMGAAIFDGSAIPMLVLARDIALHHHERWDGFGYPNGLRGEGIPPAARIVGVVDVYDALVHRRPYKPAYPEEQAIAIMQEQCGKHFDPEVFEAFLAILPEARAIRTAWRDEPLSASGDNSNLPVSFDELDLANGSYVPQGDVSSGPFKSNTILAVRCP